MCRRRRRQHPVIGEAPFHAEEGCAEHQQQRDNGQAERQRAAHDECRRPVPELRLDRTANGVGPVQQAPRQPSDIQGVQPVTQQHDGRRRDDNRRQRGERDGGDTGVGERLQDVHREQDHRRHRQRHRRRRDQHRAPRRRHRADQGGVRVGALGQFVAIAADDQQRVVDRQGEAHRGAEVGCEVRHIGTKGDEAQDGHRAQDRHQPNGNRECGRQQAAEHPDQHEEAQRNGDRLHQQQIALQQGVDLRIHHGVPA